MDSSTWTLPRSKAWRRIYIAHTLSCFGDAFTSIALLSIAYELKAGVMGLVSVSIAQAVPNFIISPIAGAIADRGHKKRLLVAADFARCIVMLLIYAARSFRTVIALAASGAVFTAIFEPVEAALEPEFLLPQETLRANAIRTSTRSIIRIVGPAAVAFILMRNGVRIAFLFDAFTFAVSGALLLRLPKPFRPPTTPRRVPSKDIVTGIRRIWRLPDLRLLLCVQAIVAFLLGMQRPVLYDFVETQLGRGGDVYALLMSTMAAGALLGSVSLYRTAISLSNRVYLFMLVLLVDAVALMCFTYSRSVFRCCVFMAFLGLISSAFQILVRTYLQTIPEPGFRGRIFGVFSALNGPILVLSLTAVIPLARFVEPVGILRGAAVSEAVVAAAGLVVLQAVYQTNSR